jgi:hypothetical protein
MPEPTDPPVTVYGSWCKSLRHWRGSVLGCNQGGSDPQCLLSARPSRHMHCPIIGSKKDLEPKRKNSAGAPENKKWNGTGGGARTVILEPLVHYFSILLE